MNKANKFVVVTNAVESRTVGTKCAFLLIETSSKIVISSKQS